MTLPSQPSIKEFIIDISSFNIEAATEDEAWKKARKMIDEDPGTWAEICGVEPA